jgi:hypothetical protein
MLTRIIVQRQNSCAMSFVVIARMRSRFLRLGDLNAAERRRLYKELEWRAIRLAPGPKRVRKRKQKLPSANPASTPIPAQRSQPSERACALVRERLADGPKPGSEIEAAAEPRQSPLPALGHDDDGSRSW